MTDRSETSTTRTTEHENVDEPGSILPDGLQRRRQKLAQNPALDLAYRIGVGVVGTAVLIVGVVLIPYPGPGWLIVFAGLGILATEFSWAHRLLRFARAKYDAFADWLKVQHWSVQLLFGLFTLAIVLATLWILGALELAAGWVGIDWPWLASPLF